MITPESSYTYKSAKIKTITSKPDTYTNRISHLTLQFYLNNLLRSTGTQNVTFL